MAVLESCPKHNMVAYLEKTEGNATFHEVIDFLARSSIHHALTVTDHSKGKLKHLMAQIKAQEALRHTYQPTASNNQSH
ncbi:hypothetical protein Tco_0981092 [Tanacetum coccineum]